MRFESYLLAPVISAGKLWRGTLRSGLLGRAGSMSLPNA